MLPVTKETHHKRRIPSQGFSLVEVVLAIGIFAVAVVAVIGLLAPSAKSVSDNLDTNTAQRLADNIQQELNRYGYQLVVDAIGRQALSTQVPVYMVGTRDGSRVLFTAEDAEKAWSNPTHTSSAGIMTVGFSAPAENELYTDATPQSPLGIAFRDRYFLIEIQRSPDATVIPSPTAAMYEFKNHAATATTLSDPKNAFIPITVRIIWPYLLPKGPGNYTGSNSQKYDDSTDLPWQMVPMDQHNQLIYNTILAP